MEKPLVERVEDSLHKIFYAMSLDRYSLYNFHREFTFKNLTITELRVLRYVTERGEASLKDIRALVRIPNSTLTSMIKRFEQRGLFVRLPNEEDRRSCVLRVTDLGRAIHDQHSAYDKAMAAEFLARLGSPEAAEAFICLAERAASTPLVPLDDYGV